MCHFGLVNTVLDQWAHAEIFSKVFAQPRAVVALVGGNCMQFARVLAAKLLADVSITSFSGRFLSVFLGQAQISRKLHPRTSERLAQRYYLL